MVDATDESAAETLGVSAISFSRAFHMRATWPRSSAILPSHSSYHAEAPMVFQSAWYSPRYPIERRESAPREHEFM
jgi:hypothetical protein